MGLRNKQLFYLDQLFNLDFTSLLEWTHLVYLNKCDARGRTPKWFHELHTFVIANNFQEIIDLLRIVHNNINPFTNVSLFHKPNQGAWYSQMLHNNLIVGKEVKPRTKDNLADDQILIQHHLQLSKGLEPTSVLLPCDKCPLNTHNHNENNRCLMVANKEEILQIPVNKSSVSTSNTLSKRIKPRIRMPLKDIVKLHSFGTE